MKAILWDLDDTVLPLDAKPDHSIWQPGELLSIQAGQGDAL